MMCLLAKTTGEKPANPDEQVKKLQREETPVNFQWNESNETTGGSFTHFMNHRQTKSRLVHLFDFGPRSSLLMKDLRGASVQYEVESWSVGSRSAEFHVVGVRCLARRRLAFWPKAHFMVGGHGA
jgi:hypothetical protein